MGRTLLLLSLLAACAPVGNGADGDDAAPSDAGAMDARLDAAAADTGPDGSLPDGAAPDEMTPDAAPADEGAPDGARPDAAPPLDLELRTEWGSVETLAVYTEDIYAIWWDPRFDHAADAPIMAAQLIEIRRDCIDDLGMADPPNPPAGFYYNVYIHRGADDDFPEAWGNGQGTDRFGMPFLTLPVGAHRDRGNLYHEGFHIFQYSATSPGFEYRGDSQWYVESAAQWYQAENIPDGEATFVEAGAIVANPQLALWHSFSNEAPGDPTDWLFQVRQYGMHTWLYYMTVVAGVPRAVVSDGFYAGTALSPQRYHVEQVGLDALRDIFADWAAHNTGGLDYLTPAQVERAELEADWVGDPENRAPFAIEVGSDGTDDWVRPPARLAPRPWAYNVVRFTGEPGAYAFEFEADAMGAEGAAGHFAARMVNRGVGGARYVSVPLEGGRFGGGEVVIAPDDTEAALVVVSVPAHYTGNQTFGYRVRVAPAR